MHFCCLGHQFIFIFCKDSYAQSIIVISTRVFVDIGRVAPVGICAIVIINIGQQALYTTKFSTTFVDTLLLPITLLSDAFKYVLGVILLRYVAKYIIKGIEKDGLVDYNLYFLFVAVVMWGLNLYLLREISQVRNISITK